jgi:hypothetical protein
VSVFQSHNLVDRSSELDSETPAGVLDHATTVLATLDTTLRFL